MSIIKAQKKRKASTLEDENAIHPAICKDDGLISPVLIQSEETQPQPAVENSSSDEWAEINQKRVSFHNKVQLRVVKRVGIMQRHKVWYARTEYAKIRERESKRKRDSVLQSYGIELGSILATTHYNNKEAAILNGDRSIRVLERNLKVHKSNHARHETCIRLLQEKMEKEEAMITKTRASLVDAKASMQASIQTFKPSPDMDSLEEKKDTDEDIGIFSDAEEVDLVATDSETYSTQANMNKSNNTSPVTTENAGAQLSPHDCEDTRFARIVELEAELARLRAYGQ